MLRHWIRSLFLHQSNTLRALRRRLSVESLEDRILPAMILVVNDLDSGAGSLRVATVTASTLSGTMAFRDGGGVFWCSLESVGGFGVVE